MGSFIKVFFASFLAIIAFAFISIVAIVLIVSIATSKDKIDIGEKAVLLLDLEKKFEEQEDENYLAAIIGDADGNVPGLFDVVRMLKKAKTDDNVKGLYIKCNQNSNGFASSEELRNAVIDFKRSGKFVIAYGDVISQKAYYIASAADKLYCNPKGNVEWTGFASTLFFLKGTLEKLEIEPQIFYAGKFKSATEPLREYKMTEPNRLQTSVYLNDLYGRLLLAANKRSNTDTATLHELANTASIQTANDAVKFGLISAVKYDDEVKTEIIKLLKIEEKDKINIVSFSKYANSVSLTQSGANRVAIIYAEGEIVDGKGDKGQIASDEFKKIIRKVRLDKSVKAVVLRVNSPGGSALASEIIWREISLTKKEKPVVVSFGDVAASGGYYISCNADSIFAQPNTITGSIGVFGIIPNMGPFFRNKLGVTFDEVKTGPFADMPNVSRALTSAEKQFIQNSIDTIYFDFKSRVATGRKKSLTYIDSIAQGRVWTGTRALSLGLVDRLGNMQDAIDCAVKMAKLKDGYGLKEYPEKKGLIESMVSGYQRDIKSNFVKEELGEDGFNILQQLKSVKKMFSIPQARIPFNISIE